LDVRILAEVEGLGGGGEETRRKSESDGNEGKCRVRNEGSFN